VALDETPEKAFSRMSIAAKREEDNKDFAVLIDGPPKVLPRSLNRDKHFVKVPSTA